MNVAKVVLAVVLGLSAYVVGALSDGLLGAARSPTPPATFVIMGAYLAVCQFLVAAKGVPLRANQSTLLGMAAPFGVGFIIYALSEPGADVLGQGIPILLAGGLGPLAGAVAAGVTHARRSGT